MLQAKVARALCPEIVRVFS
jgi:hypothetical protein